MTITFHCPFCTAAIAVDEEMAGKPGRCPMCASRVTVPRPSGTIPVAESTATTPPAEVPNAPAPVDAVLPDVTSAPAGPPIGALPDPTRSSLGTNSIARRVKRRARGRRFPWIPLVFVAIFLGILASLAGLKIDWGPLNGELSGVALEELDREPSLLTLETSSLPKRQIEGMLETFRAEPVILSGNLMNAQLRGTERGLNLSVRQGRETSWYQVDPRSNSRLSKYLNEHASTLEEARIEHVRRALDEFLEVALRVQAGQEPVDSYSPFRDQLVVPGMVKGFGYHVVARVGRELFPCVVEAADGRLFFLLPPRLTQFDLVGRRLPSGETPFPGEFTVKLPTALTGERD